MFYSNSQKTSSTSSTNNTNSQTLLQASYKTYTNDHFHISFDYPADWILSTAVGEHTLGITITDKNYNDIAALNLETRKDIGVGRSGCAPSRETNYYYNIEVIDLIDFPVKIFGSNNNYKFSFYESNYPGEGLYKTKFYVSNNFSKIGETKSIACDVDGGFTFYTNNTETKAIFYSIQEKTFYNKDQVKSYMLTDEYKEIKKMFLSFKVIN